MHTLINLEFSNTIFVFLIISWIYVSIHSFYCYELDLPKVTILDSYYGLFLENVENVTVVKQKIIIM